MSQQGIPLPKAMLLALLYLASSSLLALTREGWALAPQYAPQSSVLLPIPFVPEHLESHLGMAFLFFQRASLEMELELRTPRL